MADFGLLKPFDIDHGELDGFTQQECFVLGYELAEIDCLLRQQPAICKPVHADNSERIKKACVDSERQFVLNWMPGDPSESWMQLQVAPMEIDNSQAG